MKKSGVQIHFDEIAAKYDFFTSKRQLHYSTLKKLLKELIGVNRVKILEIGCGTGDLLASLNPKTGYGSDISPEMIKLARFKYGKTKNLHFSTSVPKGKFEYIFMCDVIEHVEDRLKMFKDIAVRMDSETIFINTMMNPVWEPIEQVYTFLKLKMPEGPHYRASYKELLAEMKNAGLKVRRHGYTLLMPVQIPFITNFINKYLEKYFKRFCFIEYFSAQKA